MDQEKIFFWRVHSRSLRDMTQILQHAKGLKGDDDCTINPRCWHSELDRYHLGKPE